jgi:hypothetical protein
MKELLTSSAEGGNIRKPQARAIGVETKTLLQNNCAVINPDDRAEETNPGGQAATRIGSKIQDQKWIQKIQDQKLYKTKLFGGFRDQEQTLLRASQVAKY